MTRALLAGLVATIVVSILMVANAHFAVVPGAELIADWTAVLTNIGLPGGPAEAWIAHFAVGTLLWGGVFAAIHPILPGNAVVGGIVFGLITWVATMLVFAPLVGHDVFLLDRPRAELLSALGLHLVFGLALAITYDLLSREDEWR